MFLNIDFLYELLLLNALVLGLKSTFCFCYFHTFSVQEMQAVSLKLR